MQIRIALFNHVLGQHPEIRARLAEHAGRRLTLVVEPLAVTAVVTPEGWLAECHGEGEATIRVRAVAAVLAQWTGRAPGFEDVSLEGDMTLAQPVAALLAGLRWVPADDLSRLFGDMAASRIETLVKGSVGLKGQMAARLAESALEHWREETPLLAGKRSAERWMMAVDTLRDDAERFEKRLERLEAGLRSKNN